MSTDGVNRVLTGGQDTSALAIEKGAGSAGGASAGLTAAATTKKTVQYSKEFMMKLAGSPLAQEPLLLEEVNAIKLALFIPSEEDKDL